MPRDPTTGKFTSGKGGKQSGFKFTGKWKKMTQIVDKDRFAKALETNVERSTRINAMIVAREIRAGISGRRYTGNAGLTILIKRSSTPLVDDSDLFGSITHDMINSKTAFAGALRSRRVGDQSAADIAAILHEGVEIQVTPAMRGLFFALANVGAGKMDASQLEGRAAEIADRLGPRISQVRPLAASTNIIVIPPRPFMKAVIESSKLRKLIQKNWTDAIEGAIQAKAV